MQRFALVALQSRELSNWPPKMDGVDEGLRSTRATYPQPGYLPDRHCPAVLVGGYG
jgi:hypothetical protein